MTAEPIETLTVTDANGKMATHTVSVAARPSAIIVSVAISTGPV